MKQRLAKLTNLQQRVIAAVAGVPVILFMIWYADWTFALLFTLVSALTQREFYRLLVWTGLSR
jgi:phosphatidate cytidylyltransferase